MRIFLLKFSILTFNHKIEDFKHTLSSSIGVDRGITGDIWGESPAYKIIALPIGFSVDFLYDQGKFSLIYYF